ncbi:hypothetical protein CBU97_08460 [Salmonella enterica subsp. enterica serovar Montevideo]|nr:hypothetical protein [Salmonella enterica]ECH4008141.1 hypothetical protein [Salmonella enterica subsp. enterica serovar Montevideo]EBM1330950.1 hypothetical protein [Salmonella enterica]ECT8738543.1 hypothetical protein [Salmonella enterica subsp. enterica serovar Montevideo]EDH6962589.1 hypothetical protein [Salmonella enterica subsp. enterica serovar Montevideo]
MTQQTQSQPLAIAVKRAVRHDLTVRFRDKSYSLHGIPDLVSGMIITITHYDWYLHERLIVNFVNNAGASSDWLVGCADMATAA